LKQEKKTSIAGKNYKYNMRLDVELVFLGGGIHCKFGSIGSLLIRVGMH
jgi:hypothetical protein